MKREKLICYLLLLITVVAKSQMIGDLSKKQQATFELFYFLPNVEKKLNEQVTLPINFKTNRIYDITFYLDSLGYVSNIRYKNNEYKFRSTTPSRTWCSKTNTTTKWRDC